MGLKARVIATGEIVEVDECGQTFKDMGWDYMDMRGRCYKSEDLDFRDNTPFDYWTRLEHTYAGMAMQGIIARYNVDFDMVVEWSADLAHALVEKLKEKEVILTQEQIDTMVHESCVLFCKHCGCGVPRETCTSLGSCKDHDEYRKSMRTYFEKHKN